LKQKKRPVLDITRLFFRIRTQVTTEAVTWVRIRKKKPVIGRHLSTHVEKETCYRSSPEYACGKRNPLYPIRATSICFNNIVSNLCNNSAVEKTNGMTFNPTATLKLIYWFIYHQSIVHFPKMSSIIYPYVPINPIYFVNWYSEI
jgi:hypothetical protein